MAPLPAVALSLWSASATPDVVSYSDGASYELGVTFTSDVSGTITALRFYKSPSDTGPHVGNLWDNYGDLLATVPFTNETPSGWQQVSLPAPVSIQAGAVYVASYSDSSGYYAISSGYFASGYDNPPLHAPADGTLAPNGVFSYTPGTFPNQTYESTNYWADVVFTPDGSGGGTGAPALTYSPASLSFGNVGVGSTSFLPVVLTNTGTASVTVSQVAASGAGFTVSGPSLPLTLPAGSNATFTVTFAPTASGSVSGSLSIVSDDVGSPGSVSLAGTGVNSYSVALSWGPSDSSGVIGYNVYRSSTSGGPYTELNSSPITGMAYTDSTVQAGQTYYYVATAVDSIGQESVYSDEIQVVVPFP